MEDAKITQDGNAQPTGIPSLVTDKDLKQEIGEWVVTSLNKDKMLGLAGVRIAALMDAASKQDVLIAEAVNIKKSNELLLEKNAALALSAGEERQESKTAIIKVELECKNRIESVELEVKVLTEGLAVSKRENADKDKEIRTLKGKCTRLEKKLKVE